MFSNNLKRLRELKNITQEELAKILNTTQATISRYENGTREADYNTLKKLCIILDTDYNELLE